MSKHELYDPDKHATYKRRIVLTSEGWSAWRWIGIVGMIMLVAAGVLSYTTEQTPELEPIMIFLLTVGGMLCLIGVSIDWLTSTD